MAACERHSRYCHAPAAASRSRLLQPPVARLDQRSHARRAPARHRSVRCATHTANTNGSPVHFFHSSPGRTHIRYGEVIAPVPSIERRVADHEARDASTCRIRIRAKVRRLRVAGDEHGLRFPDIFEQHLEQMHARHRAPAYEHLLPAKLLRGARVKKA